MKWKKFIAFLGSVVVFPSIEQVQTDLLKNLSRFEKLFNHEERSYVKIAIQYFANFSTRNILF